MDEATQKIGIELALRAFDEGFTQGANPKKRGKRHTVDSSTHEHWRAGFDAGRAAYDEAARKYRTEVRV